MILYDYLKDRFPSIPEPCITNDGMGCKWVLHHGGVYFTAARIYLAHKDNYVYVDYHKLFISDGHKDNEKMFKTKVRIFSIDFEKLDDWESLKLREIGKELTSFSRYKKADEHQHKDEENPTYQFESVEDYTPIDLKNFMPAVFEAKHWGQSKNCLRDHIE